jgi:protease PrsW
MTLPLFISLAFAPALFWFWFFARRDVQPEPAILLLRTFGWGAAIFMLFWIGVVEETLKYWAARNIIHHRDFDEPIDGLIYATAAALGFATLENILYMLLHGGEVILLRGPITTLGHILFALPWGYAMAIKRFQPHSSVLRKGLLLSALLHGLFDGFLLGGSTEGFGWLLLPFFPLIFIMLQLSNRYFHRIESDCLKRQYYTIVDDITEVSQHNTLETPANITLVIELQEKSDSLSTITSSIISTTPITSTTSTTTHNHQNHQNHSDKIILS